MEEALAQEQHRSTRNNAQLAVIMIDIDHFKKFNDDFGHDGGDAVLRVLGDFLKKHVRGSDIACRYGGEEFLADPVAVDRGRRAAARREDPRGCEAARASTMATGTWAPSPCRWAWRSFPTMATETAALVKAADLALYQAKSGGRNRVVMFEEKAEKISAPALLVCSPAYGHERGEGVASPHAP